MNPLFIGFENFKQHVKEFNKRIYYYISGNDYFLYFLSDGILIKSHVDISILPDTKQFFSDEIFIGATKLLFNLVEDDTRVMKGINPFVIDIVQASKTVEGENRDIQKEGVS